MNAEHHTERVASCDTVRITLTMDEAMELRNTLKILGQSSALLGRLYGCLNGLIDEVNGVESTKLFHRARVITPIECQLPPLDEIMKHSRPTPTPSEPMRASPKRSLTPQPGAKEWVIRIWRVDQNGARAYTPSSSRPFEGMGAAHDFFERSLNVQRMKINRGEASGYDVVLGRRDLGESHQKETGWEEIKVQRLHRRDDR